MPLPIAHGLVGASVVALRRPQRKFVGDWKLLLFGAALAISPDFDFFFVWVLHLGRSWHRGFTHSILIALLATSFLLLPMGLARARDALSCGAAFLSHGLLDFATTKQAGGVELLFPFSPHRFKLGMTSIFEFARGFEALQIIKSSVVEFAVFAPMLLAILMLRAYVSSK